MNEISNRALNVFFVFGFLAIFAGCDQIRKDSKRGSGDLTATTPPPPGSTTPPSNLKLSLKCLYYGEKWDFATFESTKKYADGNSANLEMTAVVTGNEIYEYLFSKKVSCNANNQLIDASGKEIMIARPCCGAFEPGMDPKKIVKDSIVKGIQSGQSVLFVNEPAA